MPKPAAAPHLFLGTPRPGLTRQGARPPRWHHRGSLGLRKGDIPSQRWGQMEKLRHGEGQPKATGCRAGTGTLDSGTLATAPQPSDCRRGAQAGPVLVGQGVKQCDAWSTTLESPKPYAQVFTGLSCARLLAGHCTKPKTRQTCPNQQGANSHPGHCCQTCRPRGPLRHCAPEPHTASMRAQTLPADTRPRTPQIPSRNQSPRAQQGGVFTDKRILPTVPPQVAKNPGCPASGYHPNSCLNASSDGALTTLQAALRCQEDHRRQACEGKSG